MAQKILWVDDEIEHLKAHVQFLQGKGYEVSEATNGEDALDLVRGEKFDVLLLDETMPGMGGLETLNVIKDIDPALQVVMITKNEEERLMDEAIGMKISDYLLKPVSPLQIYSACRRILDSHKLQGSRFSQDYVREFTDISTLIDNQDWNSWVKIHRKLSTWDLEFDRFRDSGLESTHDDQKVDVSKHFSRFVEANYRDWVHTDSNRPPMSVDIFPKFVAPRLRDKGNVVFVLIDCVRLDQWMIIESLLGDVFDIHRDYYMSILPTATPYSRNAIFSGLYPQEIAERFPDKWLERTKDETSLNKFENFFMKQQMGRHGLGDALRYVKIHTVQEANDLRKRYDNLFSLPFVSLVFNFVDILTHGRNQSEILQQIAPDEGAFRSVVRSWFAHSVLLDMLRQFARRGTTVVMTTDHGSILGRRASMVYGRRDTSTNLRYKYGDNLKCDDKQAIIVRKPTEYRLPAESRTKNYLFAKEYYYFVYPTNHRNYEKQYQGSFQHGGVSLEEMILPCLTLTPRT